MPAHTAADERIARRDPAVRLGAAEIVVPRVKTALEELLAAAPLRLPEPFRQPCADTYARRLLHRDDEIGYTALVMVWGPGQATALHDHAGIWCVEAVVEGEVEVEQWELLEERAEGRCRFVHRSTRRAGIGAAGALIPPLEHHVLRNPSPTANAITLHVYGGKKTSCSVFVPEVGGTFRRAQRELAYSA